MESSRKGVIPRLFGAILVMVGAMNGMLYWRGGFALDDLPVFLVAAGLFLYFLGSISRKG